jgi:hypothetical protein
VEYLLRRVNIIIAEAFSAAETKLCAAAKVGEKVIEFSAALFISVYARGNAELEARDITAAANRVVGVVNAVLCREGEDRAGIYVRDFKKCEAPHHPYIAAIQFFKNGKCRLTLKTADYAARVAAALERQKTELVA